MSRVSDRVWIWIWRLALEAILGQVMWVVGIRISMGEGMGEGMRVGMSIGMDGWVLAQ